MRFLPLILMASACIPRPPLNWASPTWPNSEPAVSRPAIWDTVSPRPSPLADPPAATQSEPNHGTDGAVIGAVIGGSILARARLAACDHGDGEHRRCAGPVLGSALVGATVGGVIGALIGGQTSRSRDTSATMENHTLSW